MEITLKINTDGKPLHTPDNTLSDKNKKDIPFDIFSNEVAIRCKQYMFLEWQSKKNYKLVKSLYNKMYSISDVMSLIILNN